MTKSAAAETDAASLDAALADLIGQSKRTLAARDFEGGTLERRSIAEQVANRIISMIKSGNLKPGDKLPTEQQMSVAFGISRPPLREALKALTLMGVLSSRQGGRYTITDLSPARMVAPFNTMLSIADYSVHEQFGARSVVDIELVRLCAEHAGPELRQRLLKLAVDGRAFEQDPVAFRLLDIEFHQTINTGAGNGLLAALAQILYDLGLDVRRTASELPGVIRKSVAQHVAVAEAIVAGETDAAVAAYLTHLEHVRDTTIAAMRRAGS